MREFLFNVIYTIKKTEIFTTILALFCIKAPRLCVSASQLSKTPLPLPVVLPPR